MEAHLQGLQGKPMRSNLVCEIARYRGTTPLSCVHCHHFSTSSACFCNDIVSTERDFYHTPVLLGHCIVLKSKVCMLELLCRAWADVGAMDILPKAWLGAWTRGIMVWRDGDPWEEWAVDPTTTSTQDWLQFKGLDGCVFIFSSSMVAGSFALVILSMLFLSSNGGRWCILRWLASFTICRSWMWGD
jgi:hypothetical protein